MRQSSLRARVQAPFDSTWHSRHQCSLLYKHFSLLLPSHPTPIPVPSSFPLFWPTPSTQALLSVFFSPSTSLHSHQVLPLFFLPPGHQQSVGIQEGHSTYSQFWCQSVLQQLRGAKSCSTPAPLEWSLLNLMAGLEYAQAVRHAQEESRVRKSSMVHRVIKMYISACSWIRLRLTVISNRKSTCTLLNNVLWKNMFFLILNSMELPRTKKRKPPSLRMLISL